MEKELSILVRAKGAAQAARDIGKVDTAVGKTVRNIGSGLKTAGKNLAILGGGIAVGLGAAVNSGIDSLTQLEDATTSVDGAIRSVGQTGQETAGQVAGWANEIEANIGAAFDDKDITAATATLIRFGKVTPSNLRPAMQVMTDLAVKTGSVDSAATLLAKALADPTKAAGKLARAGVVLTKGQQDQIKALVKAGKAGAAQKVILDALTQTTQGAAAASQGPYKRSQSELRDVFEDTTRALAEGFLPVIEHVRDLLKGELAKPQTLTNIREFGKGLAKGLDNLITIAKNLPWGVIGDSLKAAAGAAKTVLDAFVSLPAWVQTAVLTGWGLNKITGGLVGDIFSAAAGGLIKGVLGMTAGVVNINAGVVNGAGLPGGGGPSLPGSGINPATAVGGMSTAAALGIGGPVLAGGLIAAVNSPLWVKSGALNDALQSKGLTQAERAAQQYYTASAKDQAEMRKHLGFLPSKADFDSGNAKLQAAQQRASQSEREGMQTAARATAEASRAAGQTAAAAIRDKDLSVTIKNSIQSSVVVNTRAVGSGIVKTTIRSGGGAFSSGADHPGGGGA